MKKALVYEWQREKVFLQGEEPGIFNYRLVYLCTLRVERLVVNVWRDGSRWVYVIVGWPRDDVWRPVLAHGSGGTKNEAQWYAEQKLIAAGAENPQTTIPF
jgi:hypothetical protein